MLNEQQEVTVSQAEGILRSAYWNDVRELARDIEARLAEECETREEAEEALHDVLWETIDSTSRVIYTHSAIDTLRWSENDAYAIDELGLEPAKDGCIDWSGLAFGALYADVSEMIDLDDVDAWADEA